MKKNIGVNKIAKLLNTSPVIIRKGLVEGVFPWGYAIKNSSVYTYVINLKKFEEVEGIRISDE